MVNMHIIQTITFLLIAGINEIECLPCNRRYFGQSSFVCVCSASQNCDTFPPIKQLRKGNYVVYTSNKSSLRFRPTYGNFSHERNVSRSSITINRNVRQQLMQGFGGAFTDSATKNILSLSASLQEDLLQAYFGPNGIEYNMGRVPIGGSDFSIRAYSYDDTKNADPQLKNFQLAPEDLKWKIPVIRRVQEIQPELQLLASAWTAPKWMKTNGKYIGGEIETKYLQTWAEYHLRFFDEYNKHNISFWAVTTGNEPALAGTTFEINSVGWRVGSMNHWIIQHLGPTIRNSSYRYLKIFSLDDERLFLPWLPIAVLQGAAKELVDGIAVHWYLDRLISPAVLDLTHKIFPDKLLLNTESCTDKSVLLGDWSRAEEYAGDMIQNFNHYVQGWIDWNLALNMFGGPTYTGNAVDSAIIVHEAKQEFYKQPLFYALGHFSKFIPKGTSQIAHSTNADVEVAAFQRPDDGIVVIMLNRNPILQTIVLNDIHRGQIEISLSANSISSLLYW